MVNTSPPLILPDRFKKKTKEQQKNSEELMQKTVDGAVGSIQQHITTYESQM
jgi:hypothetical protein